jgi:transcriptional regulator with AAA-type ATPase domain
LNADAHAALRNYAWPGNVRELRNMAERLVLADWRRPVDARDLPFEVRAAVEHQQQAPPPTTNARSVVGQVSEEQTSVIAQKLLDQFGSGEDFWEAVYRPFKARELTRQDLANLIDAGLRITNGSYRTLLTVFNLPSTDYKRFHAFLYQQNCNLPVGPYRKRPRRKALMSDGRSAFV